MPQSFAPQIFPTSLLTPRSVTALQHWIDCKHNHPHLPINVIGVLQLLDVYCPFEELTSTDPILVPARECSVLSRWLKPVIDGLEYKNQDGASVGDIDDEDLLEGRLPNYAQISLEINFGLQEQTLEYGVGVSELLASSVGVEYFVYHLRDASILVPTPAYFFSQQDAIAQTPSDEQSTFLKVFLHQNKLSYHQRLERVTRLPHLNKAIADIWAQNFEDNEPHPFQPKALTSADLF